jgi:hypothetical protein
VVGVGVPTAAGVSTGRSDVYVGAGFRIVGVFILVACGSHCQDVGIGRGIYHRVPLLVEGLVAVNWKGELEILQVEGDTVTTKSRTWADPTRALGVAPLEATLVYTVQDGKIKGWTWTLSDESLAKLQAAMAALPESGGDAFPTYALVMALAGLAIVGGIGLTLLRRRSHQQG